jgi:acylphosphatase
MKQCLKIKVFGQVQGTGYREFAKKAAHKLEIEGTAQNIEDGSVVIYACGDSNNLDSFLDELYKGPKNAHIKNIEAEPFLSEKDFRGVFRVIGFE